MKKPTRSRALRPLAASLGAACLCACGLVLGIQDHELGAPAADGAPPPSESGGDGGIDAHGIVFRGVQQAGPLDGNALQIDVPSVVSGDLMLLALYQYNPQATVSGLDPDWETRVSIDPAGQDGVHGTHSLRILTRFATGGEPPAYKIQLADPTGTGDSVSGILAAWGGTQSPSPFDVRDAVSKGFVPFVVPSVTTNFADEVLVAVVSTTYGKGASWTAPTNMAPRASTGVLGLFDAPWNTPGPTGDRAYSSSAAYQVGSGAAVFALRPR